MMIRKSRRCEGLAFFFLLITIFSTASEAKNRQLVWADEFNNAAIDRAKWNFLTGPTYETLHYFTDRPANAKIVDGKLNIIALRESYQGFNYTAALVKTQNLWAWRCGRVEARIKLPHTTGFVPGFWLLPQDDRYGYWPWGGEIDIMEHPTNQDRIFGTCHTWQYSYFTGSLKPAGGSIRIADSETVFHIYAIEWSADKIDFFVDDQKYFTFNNEHSGFETWPFDQPFYAILAMGVGGNWVGNPDATTMFPAVMEVDYVRVYQDLADLLLYGPDFILQGSKALTYYSPVLEGARYHWSVPNTAQITSGQGTAQITVDWGIFSGDVELQLTTNDGSRLIKYPVIMSNNLINNSGFEKGAKYWNKAGSYPVEAVFTISTQDKHSGENAMAVDVKTPGVNAWDVQLSQPNLSLKSGQTYTVSLWAQSATNSKISVAVINSATFFLYGNKTVQLTNAWAQYDFSFKMSANVTGSLNIDLGDHAGKYIFDDLQVSVPKQSDDNQVKNADFSAGDSGWNFNCYSPADANVAIKDGEWAVSITNGGAYAWDVHVGQAEVAVEQGKEYTVSFDAYAEAPRTISPLVGKNAEPWTVYSGSRSISLSTERQTYSYSFIMNNPTDHSARLGFDLGLSVEDVFLDNIYMSKGVWPSGIASETDNKPHSFTLFQNSPNPFNSATMIRFELKEPAFISLDIYDLSGKWVETILKSYKPVGMHSVPWNGGNVASGIYFCKMTADQGYMINKMSLIK
jgi:beta-glucanase (GH16 family)